MSTGRSLAPQPAPRSAYAGAEVTLLDLLDRLLHGGIVIQGDITLAAANIDLVNLSLRLVVGAVDALGRDLRGPIDTGIGQQ
jgi:hypothetical protein